MNDWFLMFKSEIKGPKGLMFNRCLCVEINFDFYIRRYVGNLGDINAFCFKSRHAAVKFIEEEKIYGYYPRKWDRVV